MSKGVIRMYIIGYLYESMEIRLTYRGGRTDTSEDGIELHTS
jgi:hypothetical protein